MPDFARPALLFAVAAAVAVPISAKDSLGVFASWAAFHDPTGPRCYAIAKPASNQRGSATKPYASIGTWPESGIRNQLHLRLSQQTAPNARITLRVGTRSFILTGGGSDAWARDPAMDAAIVAAMRSADRMIVRSTTANGRRIADSYALAGAATAIDAATVACSNTAR